MLQDSLSRRERSKRRRRTSSISIHPALGRGSRGRFAFSTGPINDRFAKAFSQALFAYTTYQLGWAAQVVNKLVAQYAVVEKKSRQDVQDLYMTLRPVEADFRRFLKNKVSARKTFFGIKALRSPRSR